MSLAHSGGFDGALIKRNANSRPSINVSDMKLEGGFDCDDVIMEIYL